MHQGVKLSSSRVQLCTLKHETKPIKQRSQAGYWENKENVLQFLSKIKEKYNLSTPEDWNSITQDHIRSNGGRTLLKNYSMFELKCTACPEGKLIFNNPHQAPGYWENRENVLQFLSKIKEKYNLHSPEDWNSITQEHIRSNRGRSLLKEYSIFELKCMACPEGKSSFNKPYQAPGYWKNEDNILQFLSSIKEKYNLYTPEDWNLITQEDILLNGGGTLLNKYTMFQLKRMACPEGKLIFNNPPQLPGYWENKENILQFLSSIKEKYNLNTPEDWNSITYKHIRSNGGSTLLKNYSIFELKCMACPEGKSSFNNPHQISGYWENRENILQFLSSIQEKYNLNTPEDWNSITGEDILSNGGGTLLNKYSMFELKCLACPEGKSSFNNPNQTSGYWENKENILQFLSSIKEKYNLNTPEDWNSIIGEDIISNGGGTLLNKHSMFELKCMACPEGKLLFNNPQPPGYWKNEENILKYLAKIKEKYNLHTPKDWKRLSRNQIASEGGWGLFYNKNYLDIKIKFENPNKAANFVPLAKLISGGSIYKRASQRWLFLQIQKLFPGEEIVEDYFHSDISRNTGANVQFDIFMIQRNIAVEYHGKHHYEDVPSRFAFLEAYQYRDLEKEKLCKQHEIQLIVIPYWWDNKLDTLRTILYSKLK